MAFVRMLDYFWKKSTDRNINLRILSHSFLYPYNSVGFGKWVVEYNRPIIVHGTAKPGKMIKGEAEFRVHGTKFCLDVGAAPAKDQIGAYGCHSTEHRGGSQGFIWLDGLIRVAYGKSDRPGEKTCVDGRGVKAGEPLVATKCRANDAGQHWTYNNQTRLLRNSLTNLCVDTMQFDSQTYPEAAKRKSKQAVSVQPCGNSKVQQLDITLVSLEESVSAVERRRGQRAH